MRKLSNTRFRFPHQGQALVEYAIILFLMLLLLVGGAELGMAALSSGKNDDAAKAGASEYSELVAKQIEIKTAIDRQLMELAMLNCNYVNDNENVNSGECNKTDPAAKNYFEYLEKKYTDFNDEFITSEEDRLDIIIKDPSQNPNQERKQQAKKQLELLKNFELYIQYKPAIANHNLVETMPNCDNGEYDDGMPNRYRPRISKANDYELPPPTNSVFYFFTPTPIDITNCSGIDPKRGNKNKLDILIYGYLPSDAEILAGEFDSLYVQGLPKANQAALHNYERVCIDDKQSYVACSSNDVKRIFLKPTGKVCLAEDDENVDSCPGVKQQNIAGFYYFGNPNDATNRNQYTQNETPEFRPAFQLICNPNGDLTSDPVSDTCSNPSNIRVQTRYRRVFDGFLTMGLNTVTDPKIIKYFFNPNRVGVQEGILVSGYGSEIGPVGERVGNLVYATVKYMRDFRACYRVSTTTGTVSACN